jgi:hypothetical protein
MEQQIQMYALVEEWKSSNLTTGQTHTFLRRIINTKTLITI